MGSVYYASCKQHVYPRKNLQQQIDIGTWSVVKHPLVGDFKMLVYIHMYRYVVVLPFGDLSVKAVMY